MIIFYIREHLADENNDITDKNKENRSPRSNKSSKGS